MHQRAHFRTVTALTFAALWLMSLPVVPLARASDGAWQPVDPGSRLSHTLTADPLRHRAILFGGWDGTGVGNPLSYHNDVWALDLSGIPQWHPMNPIGPPPAARIEQTTVLDPVRDRLVVFGGKNATTYFGDLWQLTLSAGGAWSPLPANGPSPNAEETRGIYDPIRDRIVLFGGYRPGPGHNNELWQLTLSGTPTWSPLVATGVPPTPRRGHVMVYDPAGDRVIVFGGYDDVSFKNDTWQLTLSGTPAWTQLAPATPPPVRYTPGTIYDPLRMRIVMFGGASTPPLVHYNDVWSFDLAGSNQWTQLVLDNPPPRGRDLTSMVYDDQHDRAVVFGGNVLAQVNQPFYAFPVGDVWTLDLPGLPTPVMVSPARAQADPDRVSLEWLVSTLGRTYEVVRAAGGGWDVLASIHPDGTGRVGWKDDHVHAGGDYEYALRYQEGGMTVLAGQTRVTVPAAFRLGLAAPALTHERSLTVEFVLPDASPSQLELFDTSGRRVLAREVGGFGIGRHSIELPADGWRAGVYWVRLTRADGNVQQRIVKFQ